MKTASAATHDLHDGRSCNLRCMSQLCNCSRSFCTVVEARDATWSVAAILIAVSKPSADTLPEAVSTSTIVDLQAPSEKTALVLDFWRGHRLEQECSNSPAKYVRTHRLHEQ